MATGSAATANRFFTPEEFAAVDELTEMIIPADEKSPGAKAAMVAGFIDGYLADSFEEIERTDFREGLRPYVNATTLERLGLLTKAAQGEAKPIHSRSEVFPADQGIYDSRILHIEDRDPRRVGLQGQYVSDGRVRGISAHAGIEMRRRDFLGAAALIPALRAQVMPRADFPKDPRARISVASYPFRRMLDPKRGKMTLLEFPKFVVETYDVRGIEPLDEHFVSTEPKYLAKFRAALKAAGAHVVNIPVGRLEGELL